MKERQILWSAFTGGSGYGAWRFRVRMFVVERRRCRGDRCGLFSGGFWPEGEERENWVVFGEGSGRGGSRRLVAASIFHRREGEENGGGVVAVMGFAGNGGRGCWFSVVGEEG
ncbi:hypothetical protein HAX54_004942, partial [Datura stramonium]|nr:hypothetical protein [Datura stramonium]